MRTWWNVGLGVALCGGLALGLVMCRGRDAQPPDNRRTLVTVTWPPVRDHEGDYRVYYGVSEAWFDDFDEASVSPHTITSLVAEITFFVSVRVVKPDGEVTWKSETHQVTPMRGLNQRVEVGALVAAESSNRGRGGQVALTWKGPTKNADGTDLTDLSGYRVYYGRSKKKRKKFVFTMETRTTVKNLRRGTEYYFHVTALDTSGNESKPSKIVTVLVK